MSLSGLLNQTIVIAGKSSYDAYGREVVGGATNIRARIQETTKQRLLPNGSLITIYAIAYVPADTTVAVDDRVTYGGVSYKVFGKYSAVEGGGNTNHIKLELTKWQT